MIICRFSRGFFGNNTVIVCNKKKGRVASDMERKTKNPAKAHKYRAIIALLCVLTMIFAVFPITSLSVNAESAIIAKTKEALNIRSGAGTQYSVVKTANASTYVTITDRSNGAWPKVTLPDGTSGYCVADYLDVLTDCSTTAYVNFRTGPGTGYSILKTFAPSTRLDILSFSDFSWAKVKDSTGQIGYLCTDYADFVTDSTVTAAAAVKPFEISELSHSLPKGRKFTLKVTGNTGSVKWTSSNSKVATVADGVVKGVSAGSANITATDTGTNKTLTCKVTVKKTDYRFIFLDTTSKKLKQGETFVLNGRTLPEGGKINYKSSNKSVAIVSSYGTVKAVGAGTATITAYDSTGLVTRTCKVSVTPIGSIALKQSSVTVSVGSSTTIGIYKDPSNIKVNWKSSNTSIAGVNNGVVSGLRPGTAVITAIDESGKSKQKCTVTVTAVNSGNVRLSRYNATTTAGKTIYIKGYNGNTWKTSDPEVATVWDGFILTKKAGQVAISYENAYGQKAVCVVKVKDPAPVKFAYSSPNSATLSSNIKLVAITDKKRTAVYFTVKDGPNVTTVTATSKVAEGSTYVWTGTYTPKSAGTFDVKAYSKYNGAWSTCNDGKFDVYITNKNHPTETGLNRLRASDEMIKFIAEKEGFVSSITYDTLAYNVPTLGHGQVVWEGECFYDHLTRGEAYALLVKSVNDGVFTSAVNNMLINNNVRFNQQQFDALVSFSYNLGTGWTSSSDLKNILLNSYGSVTSSESGEIVGTVTATSGLNLRNAATTNAGIITVLGYNERVTLVSSERYNSVWYKVKTASGKTGYCSSTYLNISTSGSSVGYARDLNNVNRNALIKELLAYHHAGGNCYWGLLYRRVDELEMFLYNDYATDGRSNKHNFPSTSCLPF